MRTELFKEIYNLIKEISPKALKEKSGYYLVHDFTDEQPSIYLYNTGACILIGKLVFDNNNTLLEPSVPIIYDKKRKIARIANTTYAETDFATRFKSDIVDDEVFYGEKESNDLLKSYLVNLKQQLTNNRKKSYFRKVKYNQDGIFDVLFVDDHIDFDFEFFKLNGQN